MEEKAPCRNEQVSQLRAQLANCSAEALGLRNKVIPESSYGWSRAYEDIKMLRRQLEKERKYNSYLISSGRVRVDKDKYHHLIREAMRLILITLPTSKVGFEVMNHLDKVLKETEIPYEKENGSRFADKMSEFEAWRDGVDEAHLLDTFDLALGWFAGKGFGHDEALKAARSMSGLDQHSLTKERS